MILNTQAPYNRLKEPKPNSKVWRYMDLQKFLYTISNSKLFFVRLDKLPDKLEGTLTSNIIDEIQNRYNNLEFPISKKEANQRRTKEVIEIEGFSKYTLVNCWTQNLDESFALWKIYLNNQPYGISIQTRYENLKSSIIDDKFNFIFQKVYYSKKVRNNVMSSVHFRKNKFYKFENEVRIAIFSQYVNFGGEPKYKVGTDVNVDLNKLIQKIYISPFAPEWFYDFVNFLVREKYKLNFPVLRSRINEKF